MWEVLRCSLAGNMLCLNIVFVFIFSLVKNGHRNQRYVTSAINQHPNRDIMKEYFNVFMLTADIIYGYYQEYVMCLNSVLMNTDAFNVYYLVTLTICILLYCFLWSNLTRV